MLLAAKIIVGVVMVLHIYFLLLETVLFKTRGYKVFAVPKNMVEPMAVLFSNQGCYNGFLAAALALGLFLPDPSLARAFMLYGLGCVVVAGIWGAATVSKKIFFVQALPAIIGLVVLLLV
jgi:putative membrane protein